MLEDPLKFSKFNFHKISKKFPKWLLWDLSNVERNEVMRFGEPSPDPVRTANGFMVVGAIMALSHVE